MKTMCLGIGIEKQIDGKEQKDQKWAQKYILI